MTTPNSRAFAHLEKLRESLYATGFTALSGRDVPGACSAFGLMAALCPLDERSWLGLGAAHEQQEDWQLAVNFYRMSRSVAEHSVWPRLGEARALGKLGKLVEACALLDGAERLTDDSRILKHIDEVRGEL